MMTTTMSVADWIEYQAPRGRYTFSKEEVRKEFPSMTGHAIECFGMDDTPRVCYGTIPVLMHLLSPGYKPVQLTADLRSLWSNTYFEVRKELRRRYPKHSWPDNPLQADPVRGVQRSKGS